MKDIAQIDKIIIYYQRKLIKFLSVIVKSHGFSEMFSRFFIPDRKK